MVQDVIEGLKLVASGVQSIRTITEAIKSGRDYVKAKHPDIQSDLRAMVEELMKSVLVVKQASAVLTNFRFAISTDAKGSELARFNDYFIKSKADAEDLRKHIEDLRTHCSRVREHAGNIAGGWGATSFSRIFEFLGLHSPERERELGDKLDKLAYEDFAVANSAEIMLDCLERALKDVQNSLGTGGSMYPENVPAAAALLADYGPHFQKMEDQATEVATDIRKVVQELD